jgi:hypothetical protein
MRDRSNCKTTSHNIGNHDARLLYIIDLASSRAHYSTPTKDARDDVIAVDVMRHGWSFAQSKIRIVL